jgi:hypothetical protein
MNELDLARHEERFVHMESRISLLDKKVEAVASEVHEIKEILAEGRGKIKGAMMIITAASAFIGAISGLIAYFWKL